MDDLVEWLRVALDEDELVARDAGGRNWGREAYGCVVDAADNGLIVYSEGTPSREQADHIARHDPARVLREVEAKRLLLELHTPYPHKQVMARGEIYACSECGDVDDSPTEWPCDTLRLLALPYSDRPRYQESWRP